MDVPITLNILHLRSSKQILYSELYIYKVSLPIGNCEYSICVYTLLFYDILILSEF